MLADSYLPPLIMIIILLLSLSRWVDSIIRTKDIRGLSAITARLYLLYFYILLIIRPAFDSESRYLIFTLGMGAILLDESIHWVFSKLEPRIKKVSDFIVVHIKKLTKEERPLEMDNLAILGAFLTGLVSLIVSLGKIILDIKKEKRDGIKSQAEKTQIEAAATQTLSEASAVIAKQYLELLNKVKEEFSATIADLKKEIEFLRSELEKEKNNGILKDQVISDLGQENKKLNKRVEELGLELRAWKVSSGI